MKRKYFYSLVIILFVLLTLPYVMGIIFQRHYSESLKMTANHLHLDLRIMKYQRGWLHSNVTLASNFPLLDMPLPEKLDHENVLVIHQSITHGPIIFSKGPRLVIAHIQSYLEGGHPLANTWVHLDRSISTHIALRRLVLTFGHTQPYYAVNHLVGYSFLSASGHQFFTTIRCAAIDANIDHPRHIRDFAFQQQLFQSPSQLWLGKTDYHFGKLTWQQESDVYSFNDFDYEMNTKEFGKKVSANLLGNLTQVTLNGRDYGSQALSLSFSNLDAAHLKRLSELFPLSKSHLITPAQFLEAKKQLLTLLDTGAVIKVNALQLNTVWGPVMLSAESKCQGQKPSVTLGDWCSNADLTMHASIPNPLAYKMLLSLYKTRPDYRGSDTAQKWIDDRLVEWQNAGWLYNTGNQLLIDLKGGKLAVDKA